ncbi:MAG: hypothetical protein KJO45_04860 [Sulfurovum sp.]|nr:hypothetical protein [Sulfurovum sp.]
MKRMILTIIISIGLSTIAYTDSRIYQEKLHTTKPMKANKIKILDRQLTKHKTVKRNFKTKKEFLRKKDRKRNKHRASRQLHYDKGYVYNKRYTTLYRPIKQRSYNHTKRGWVLAYRYDRASFYDNEGFYYGYFNRQGYYFEGIFYRYDRYYTYRDRVNGRGLFGHRYYMPVNTRYYGFCK